MQRARSRLYTAIFPTREGIIFPGHLFEVLRLVRKPVIVSFNSLLFLSLFSWYCIVCPSSLVQNEKMLVV